MIQSVYKSLLLAFTFGLTTLTTQAQMQVELPNENGLLWEITGKGLTKPSYVYGTMHVSSKLAFHLGDSFYYALRKVDMVALEQNLDTVIDDWVIERDRSRNKYGSQYFPRTSLNTFDINKIDKNDINRAISYDPYVLNSIMFRTNEDDEDFQQETYLDLYIYRLGKKMGKIIGGVEDYKEADRLVKNAQKGAREDYKDRRKNGNDDNYYKFRNFDFNEAYRKGNIKLIDSFERTTNGPKFMEYMLFVRNENMVRRMDSIMQLDVSLFTGVGCAHLGAERGVLNLLVKEGYTLRPVQSMANRISDISKKYDDMQYPLTYSLQVSPDSTFTAQIPGDWIQAFNNSTFKVFIYPELVNGYFYTVYKLNTNGTFFGEKPEEILLKVDSSLFESVPGKIMEQKDITIDGYKGYEILNKTTEGDFQRYYIIVKPLEVCIFKLGGKKEYAKSADANKFFESIRFTSQRSNDFKKFKTADGMVSFNFPAHASKDPIIKYENKQKGNFSLTAYDENSNTTYLAQQLRANRNLDEDTFDLKVLLESFVNLDQFTLDNYKLDIFHGNDRIIGSMHGDKDRKAKTEIVIFNDRIIMLAAISEGENEPVTDFFNSLELNEPTYPAFERYYDSVAKYTVSVPSIPLEDLEQDDEEEGNGYYSYYNDDEDKGDSTLGVDVSKTFAGKNGEEIIQLRFFTKSKYQQFDSLRVLEIERLREQDRYSTIIDTFFRQEGRYAIVDATIGDTATPMVNFTRNIYSQGGFYEIYGAYNKVKGKSKFLTTFLETFEIADTVWSANPFISSFDSFYADYYTKDSMNRERLIKKIVGWNRSVAIEDEDAPKFIDFISKFHIEENYVKRKANLVEQLGWLDHKSVFPAFKQFYADFGDTTNLKMAVLTSLSRLRTKESYAFIKDKLINDLPIGASDLDNIFYKLDDSLKLVVNMFPAFLDLTIVDEISEQPYRILGRLLDSNLIKPKVYKKHLNTIYLDGYYSLKRALVKEETKSPSQLGILTEQNKDEWASTSRYGGYRSSYTSFGSNDDYLLIARLLIPYKDKNVKYKQFFHDMHKLKDVDDRFTILKFSLQHNLEYPDTLIDYYAGRKKYRMKLYDYLQEEGKLELFPATYRSSDSIIYAKLQGQFNGYYSKIDSLEMVKTFSYTEKGQAYEGRIYKMRRKGAENSEIISVTGIISDTMLSSYDYVVRLRSIIKPEQIEAEVIDKVIRQFVLMATKPNYKYYDY
jgi:uncharacterized protein YbaP (TraB family)